MTDVEEPGRIIALSQSAVSKQANGKLSGRRNCGRKRCFNHNLGIIMKQNSWVSLAEIKMLPNEIGASTSKVSDLSKTFPSQMKTQLEASYLD